MCQARIRNTNPQHELWNFLTRDLVPALIDVYGRKQSLKQLDFARQSAQERQGFYQYIDATTFPNIDAQIERIFARGVPFSVPVDLYTAFNADFRRFFTPGSPIFTFIFSPIRHPAESSSRCRRAIGVPRFSIPYRRGLQLTSRHS